MVLPGSGNPLNFIGKISVIRITIAKTSDWNRSIANNTSNANNNNITSGVGNG